MFRMCKCALVAVLALSFAGVVRADDPTEARALLDKAIKAAGGEEKLGKYKAMTWKASGTYYGMGAGLPYTGTYAVQRPGQFRMEIEGVFTIVVDGDKGWIKAGGSTEEMNKDQVAERKEDNYLGSLTMLVPLKDKAFTLTPLPEVKVDDRPAVGLKITREGHREVRFYFDKQTNLLVKSQMRVKAEEMGGKEVNQEAYYSEFKDVSGLKVPTKLVIKREGELYVDGESSEVKLLEKLDNTVFDKP
jgi:outer membrane lipoprotein-sorting protein